MCSAAQAAAKPAKPAKPGKPTLIQAGVLVKEGQVIGNVGDTQLTVSKELRCRHAEPASLV
jgi:hypothetical protein